MTKRKGSSKRGGRNAQNNKATQKRRPNKHRGNNRANNDFPELMDLEPQKGVSRKLKDEVEFTRKSRRLMFERKLRNNPVEFVKSDEVYDPSKLKCLNKIIQKAMHVPEQQEELADLQIEPMFIPEEESVGSPSEELEKPGELQGPSDDESATAEPVAEELVVYERKSDLLEPEIEVYQQEVYSEGESLLEEPCEVISDDKLFFEDTGSEIKATLVKKDFRTILEERAERLEKNKIEKNVQLIKEQSLNEKVTVKVDAVDYTPEVTVGKITMSTETTSTGEVYAKAPRGRAGKSTLKQDSEDSEDEDWKDGAIREYIDNVMTTYSINEESENDLSLDDEEMAAVQNFPDDMVNDSDFYSDLEFMDDSTEEEEEDLEFSDDEELENIQDMIAFNSSVQKFSKLDVSDNGSMRFKGRGKNKKPVLNKMYDDDLSNRIFSQFEIKRLSKADKRKRKQGLLHEDRLASHDLRERYPYSIHIKEIKAELEDFLNDMTRDHMSFPPLDPHGLRTVLKMADHFNLKGRKQGHDNKVYPAIIKTKKTYNYHVNYDLVQKLLRQRPIFNRTDVKKPRDLVMLDSNGDSKGRNNAHVKNGEIVGKDAPEISQDNIGRRMLEKLGWNSGEGLGADQKGISVPVFAMVKKNKVGIK